MNKILAVAGVQPFGKRLNKSDWKIQTGSLYNKTMKLIKSKKGQITVEYILLAVALIALFQIATKFLRNNQYLSDFQDTPGQIFKNLVENGNWKTNETESRRHHPTNYDRHFTSEGEGPK